MKWTKERLKNIYIAPKKVRYKVIPITSEEKVKAKRHPEILEFDALSVGDENGQAFIVPLDESSREVAEIIINTLTLRHIHLVCQVYIFCRSFPLRKVLDCLV